MMEIRAAAMSQKIQLFRQNKPSQKVEIISPASRLADRLLTHGHLDVVLPMVVLQGDHAMGPPCAIRADAIDHLTVHRHPDHLLILFTLAPDGDVVDGLAVAVVDFV